MTSRATLSAMSSHAVNSTDKHSGFSLGGNTTEIKQKRGECSGDRRKRETNILEHLFYFKHCARDF